jgi:hypothetical protein
MTNRNWRQIAARATDKLERGAAHLPPPPDSDDQLLEEARIIVDTFVETAEHRRALVYALIVHAHEHPTIYR